MLAAARDAAYKADQELKNKKAKMKEVKKEPVAQKDVFTEYLASLEKQGKKSAREGKLQAVADEEQKDSMEVLPGSAGADEIYEYPKFDASRLKDEDIAA